MNYKKSANSNDGLILMMSLWILALVSLLSIGLAHRVLVHIKLTRYQKDNIKLLCLAKAAIQQARAVLENDSNQGADTLNELWSCGIDFSSAADESIFKDQRLKEGSFSASYIFDEEDQEEPKIFYGLVDEERKININIASSEKLAALFSILLPELSNPKTLADAIIYWRGANPEGYEASYYEDKGYSARRDKFKTIDELGLVEGFREEPELIEKCKKFITVFTQDDNINVNTASAQVLEAVFLSQGAKDGLEKKLADFIIDTRDGDDNQEGTGDDVLIESGQVKVKFLEISGLTPEQTAWINSQGFPFTDKSNLFTIDVTARLEYSTTQKRVNAVFKRGQDNKTEIIFWHEE